MKKFSKGIITFICILIFATMLVGCTVGEKKTEKLDKTKIDSFSSIKLNIDMAKIEIVPTSGEFAIEYSIVNQNVDYSVADDVLTVNAKQIHKIGVNSDDNSYLKIYVPENSEFVKLNYEGEIGDIAIDKFTFEDVKITTDVGNVKLSEITIINNLDIKTDVGNIEVTLNNSECSYEVSADVANININGNKYDGTDVKKSYTSEKGPKVKIKTDCGEINLKY